MLSTTATRYATGLLAATNSVEQADELFTPLSEMATTLGSHSELIAAMSNPAIPQAPKDALLEQLLGDAPPLLLGLAKVMAQFGQFAALKDITEPYGTMLAEKKGILRAHVRLAKPASDELLQQIKASIERAVNSKVEIQSQIDPDILGGFVARVGDRVFDGSLARQLEHLRGVYQGS